MGLGSVNSSGNDKQILHPWGKIANSRENSAFICVSASTILTKLFLSVFFSSDFCDFSGYIIWGGSNQQNIFSIECGLWK